jgi:hypothetical protein
MTDDRMIRILEEIRDLQRQHAERYGEALVMLVLRVLARMP